jgi:hypothetical protein
VRVLHIAPHTFGLPGYELHGSTKDIETRHDYFRERGIPFDMLAHQKDGGDIASRLPAGSDYSHVLLDGSFDPADWESVKRALPRAKLIMRSHNSELPHRKDTVRAVRAAGGDEKLLRKARKNVRVYGERDLAAAAFADVVLSIEDGPQVGRYWRRMGLRGEVLSTPYFLADRYLEEVRAARRIAPGPTVVCVLSGHPGPLTFDSLSRFAGAVERLGEGRAAWRFLVTGDAPADLLPDPAEGSRIEPVGLVNDLLGVIGSSRAVAVLSDLGRGFKTKILEAILCGAWVLTPASLFRRLPEAVRPFCILTEPEGVGALDEAIGRIEHKAWPSGDPNAALKAQAFAAMDQAFLGKAKPSRPSQRRSSPALAEPVSLCTVVTPFHHRVLKHNIALTAALNADADLRWTVVRNAEIYVNPKRARASGLKPGKQLEFAKRKYADPDEIAPIPGRLAVLAGKSLEEVRTVVLAGLASSEADLKQHEWTLGKTLGSYHHAAGLDLALRAATTRYAIVIDPDLYVVRPDWIAEVIGHMQANDLAVFGVPWAPRWYQKYRRFPCSHLMVIDREKLPWRDGLLAPDLVRPGPPYISKFWLEAMRRKAGGERGWLWSVLRNAPQALREDLEQRRTITVSRDTGYEMLLEFERRPELKSGVAIPVHEPSKGFSPASVSWMQENWLVNALLPERWCYLPKTPGSFTRTGFKEAGLPDVRTLNWEEFMWTGRPFAFHVRGEQHRQVVGRFDDVAVVNTLNAALAELGASPIPDLTVCGAPAIA